MRPQPPWLPWQLVSGASAPGQFCRAEARLIPGPATHQDRGLEQAILPLCAPLSLSRKRDDDSAMIVLTPKATWALDKLTWVKPQGTAGSEHRAHRWGFKNVTILAGDTTQLKPSTCHC